MLTFDRLKLVTDSQYATNLNPSQFLKIPTKQGDYYYKYHQDTPFYLTIINTPRKSELVLEFTGKILKDDYYKLINIDTIHQCLNTINNLGICELDVDGVIRSAEVVLCDITMDVECPFSMADVKKHLRASTTNNYKWSIKNCSNNGFVIINNVTTPKYYKRFILYDKGKELRKANNRDFMDWVSDKDNLESYYKSKVRFELNLLNVKQVKRNLDIQDNKLMTVLQSKSNPILTVFDLIFNEDKIKTTTVYNKLDKLALLELCDYDLQAVEMRIRATMPRNSSISRKMEPYRKLLQDIQASEITPMNIRNLITGQMCQTDFVSI